MASARPYRRRNDSAMAERISGVKASAALLRKPGRANATRILAARSSASNYQSRGGTWSPRSPTESAAPRADAWRRKPRSRGFLDGFCDLPETMEVRRAAARVLNSLNNWIYAQAIATPSSPAWAAPSPRLMLRGRVAHVLHVGDTRAYRLRGDRLTLPDHRSRPRGRHGPVEHPVSRARRRSRSRARLRQPAARAARSLSAVQRRRARGF